MWKKNASIPIIAAFCCGALFLFHAYYYCYAGFSEWGLTASPVDRLARALAGVGVLSSLNVSKVPILLLLAFTQVGGRLGGKMAGWGVVLRRLGFALGVYFGSGLLRYLTGDPAALATAYLLAMGVGLVLAYYAMKPLTAWVSVRLSENIFNRYNESFPQEERYLTAPFCLRLEGHYRFRNQTRRSVINLVNIMRGTLVMGTPGSGKTRYIFRPLIRQTLELGMAAFIYDLKYPDLTSFVRSCMERFARAGDPRKLYTFNFDDLARSYRCNPLVAARMRDISDGAEYSRTILLALNKQWVQRQGDFFVESAVNFITASIWFLRSFGKGRYCTLPHLIELIQQERSELLSVLMYFPECRSLAGSLVSAYQERATDQLQGQIDSARVPLASLASPALYYLLSGDDFSLDINNPSAPKVVCIGSNPQKSQVYGVVVSLLMTRLLKEVNRPGGVPCHIIVDEFASITVLGMGETLATARSNQVAVTLGIQDLSQLRATYGRDRADALFNLPGNVISGQVTGDSARLISQRFGRTLQEKATISSNSRDQSVSQSQQLEPVLPESKVSTLSSGEFVGVTADTPDAVLPLKCFHAQIQLDPVVKEFEDGEVMGLPVVREVDATVVEANFLRIKNEVAEMVKLCLFEMEQTPGLRQLVVRKRGPGKSGKGGIGNG